MTTLLPTLDEAGADRPDAVTVADRSLSDRDLLGAATAVADRIHGATAVGVPVTTSLETIVAVVGAIRAGVPVVPLPGDSSARGRARLLRECGASLVLATGPTPVVGPGPPVVPVELRQRAWTRYPEPDPDRDALILHTGGTGGAPRPVRFTHRAVAAGLDLLAEAWRWTGEDILVQATPLFRPFGLVTGVLGALRVGGRLVQLTRFTAAACADAGGTLCLATAGDWSRICAAGTSARAFSAARLLVSGDAALPGTVFERLRLLTGHQPVEAYGTTETQLVIAGRADLPRRPGVLGTPLPGVQTRLLPTAGRLPTQDGAETGELAVRWPGQGSYLDGPVADPDGWCSTGDVATVTADGAHRIIGRIGTDVVRSGGRLIRGSEVEQALLTHPKVHEAAVVGTPHGRLGQQVSAFVVAAGDTTAQELVDHVARTLGAEQRPRSVHLVDRLPRSAFGRVRRSLLVGAPAVDRGPTGGADRPTMTG